jgi:hypothetical protein
MFALERDAKTALLAARKADARTASAAPHVPQQRWTDEAGDDDWAMGAVA